ncbi:hypothetical protein ACFV0T_12885 [Streptomyces sp. NPDC059582]|uniref:hypothetical protein n=1 Tax=Streptomyces sp. NPDC059582 TaxID=3346875 RepID=UPI00368A04E5
MVDPNFSGIDPDNLKRTIKHLESSSRTLQDAKSAYTSRFQKYGLDTSSLTEMGKIAGWVDDELPMLRRRQALAAAMELDPDSGLEPGAMVRLREPVTTVREAREEGARLAADANKAADLGPEAAGAEFHRIAAELAKHKGDADFVSALYAKMDPDLVRNLPVAIATTGASTAEDDVRLFGSSFTTAIDSESPAPGFEKTAALFHGPIPDDEPTAVFNRALMQGDDPALWDLAWKHMNIAVKKLGDPADTWSDSVGLLASVFGMQSKYAEDFRKRSQSLFDAARDLKQDRVNAVGKAAKRALRNETRRAGKASRHSAVEAERILSKYGLGSFSRLMEASVADGGSWLMGRIPALKPPSTTTLFGRTLHAGGKLPLVGTVLTIGATAWDIDHGEEVDVAVAANAGGMAAGAVGGGIGTWLGTAAGTALMVGTPVGWGIAGGVILGFGAGYAASYLIKTEVGKRLVNTVTGAAKEAGHAVSDAASSVKKAVSGWFS